MSKTLTHPAKEELDKMGIRFVPTNCYAPNHYKVKHYLFSFEGFDTRSEYDAMLKAQLVNSLGEAFANNYKTEDEIRILIPVVLRIAGFKDSLLNFIQKNASHKSNPTTPPNS